MNTGRPISYRQTRPNTLLLDLNGDGLVDDIEASFWYEADSHMHQVRCSPVRLAMLESVQCQSTPRLTSNTSDMVLVVATAAGFGSQIFAKVIGEGHQSTSKVEVLSDLSDLW